MIELPEIIRQAVSEFKKLPGVGEKSALRQILNITKWEGENLEKLANSIHNLKNIKHCTQCYVFSDEDICSICSSPKRQSTNSLCVVENISDYMAIENSATYDGLYHMLGGVINPLMGVGPDQLNLDSLIARVKKLEIKNIVLAINPSVEGDATCSYISKLLPDDINVERIGFGIPIGGSLEYLDPLTISKAFENKKLM